MDNTSPKISFIPKGSLVHEQSFLERPRSRSALGIFAIALFSLTIAAYGGLYFFNNFLEAKIAAQLDEIQKVQRVFASSPEVKRANEFRFRAELVRQLLDAHVAVSPILKFLSENTVKSIMYDKFAFVKDGGVTTVKINGEAPTYAALAYQKEVLAGKTEELQSAVIGDVALTTFGTVMFTLTLSFNPDYLSYTHNLATSAVVPAAGTFLSDAPGGLPVDVPAESLAASSGVSAPAPTPTLPQSPVVVPPEQSFWEKIWSWIKFW